MSEVRNYDSNEFSVTLGTVEVNSGRGDGAFFSLEPLAEDYTTQRGADGEVTVSKLNNYGATVKLTVMQTSKAHKDLHALRALGLASANGRTFAFQARDRLNGIRFEAAKAWIRKAPNEGFAREAGTREWEVELGAFTVTDETAGA